MKTKIFALIISILCLSMIFVACDDGCKPHVDANNDGVCDNCEGTLETKAETDTETETETESETETETETEEQTIAPCETHKDVDADKLCDVCARAVVVIVEQVTAEQDVREEMVVNPIPDASASEYLNTTFTTEFWSVTTTTKLNGDILDTNNYNPCVAVKVTEENEDGSITTTYQVLDLGKLENDYFKVVWEGTNSSETADTTTTTVSYSVDLSNYYFTVIKTTSVTTADGTEITEEYQVYTYAGEKLGEAWTATDEDPYYTSPTTDRYFGSSDEVYVKYYDVMYVISTETFELIYSEDADTIVARPTMDLVIGDYGYVFTGDDSLHIYDLTKWIDITYMYKPDGSFSLDNYFVLANGNVLVTGSKLLPNNSASYDIIQYGYKYDLVYIMIDVAAKTSTPVEFGYVIDELEPAVEENGFTDKAAGLNKVVVNTVKDAVINYNDEKILLVDNQLNIVCEIKVDSDMILVADGLYVREIEYYNGTSVYELVDVDGKHVRYLNDFDPNNNLGYIAIGNKVYDYNYKLLVDFDQYFNWTAHGNYYHLVKEVEIPAEVEGGPSTYEYEDYIYIPGKEPVKLENTDETKKNWTVTYGGGYYVVEYEVTETVEEAEVDVPVVEIYAPNGEKIFSVKNETLSQVYLNRYGIIEIVTYADGSYIYYYLQ